MLPFLKVKRDAAVIVRERKPDEISPENHENDELKIAAQDLIDAVHNKDVAAVAKAFRAAFDLLEVQPHDEVEHSQE